MTARGDGAAGAFLAEFTTPEQLVAAIEAIRERGYTHVDTYMPFQVSAVEAALARPRSRLPVVVFGAGVSAAGAAYFLQWLITAVLYPLNVGGRPTHLPLAFIPITFEMGVLAAAFVAVVGVMVRARLLRLWDPVFEVEGFERASIDRFWLAVRASDPAFDDGDTRSHMEALDPLRVVRVEGKLA